MELQLGVFGCLLTMQVETNTNKMHPRFASAMQHFTCVYLQAQTGETAVHMHLTNHSYFGRGNTQNTPTPSVVHFFKIFHRGCMDFKWSSPYCSGFWEDLNSFSNGDQGLQSGASPDLKS